MNWELAVEKNHEALRRILVMLITMVRVTAGGTSDPNGLARPLCLVISIAS